MAMCANCVPFDILLVLIGSLSLIVSSLVDTLEAANALQPILVLRVMRFLRLLRTLRFISYFKTLWRLVYGLVQSSSAMVSTMVLLLMSIYIAACGAVELISKDAVLRDDPETKAIIDLYFCNVETIMMVFIQFVTMDSLASIYFPIVKLRPPLFIFFCFHDCDRVNCAHESRHCRSCGGRNRQRQQRQRSGKAFGKKDAPTGHEGISDSGC